jgi:hypothetical protein
MQTRHLVDDAAEGRISRRLVAGDGLELLDRIPLDLDRDPLLGTVLGDGLIDDARRRPRPGASDSVQTLTS